MRPVAQDGRVRRSTIAYTALFCLAVLLYFALRPEPADPVRYAPATAGSGITTTTTSPSTTVPP